MEVVKDVKDLPQNEAKLKKYTWITLLVSLFTGLAYAGLYAQRLAAHNTQNENSPNMWTSMVHFLGYFALAIASGLALFGVFCKKDKYLLWFSIGGLSQVIGELICLIVGIFIIRETKEGVDEKPRWWLILLTIIAMIIFGVSALLVFFMRKLLPKSEPEARTQPNAETQTKVETKPKIPKTETKQ